MTKSEVTVLLAGISATHPNLKVDNVKPMVEAWHSLIGDMDYELAKQAVVIILRSDKYPTFPTPGAIRQVAINLSFRLPSEDETMGEILDAVHHYGYTGENKGLATLSPISRQVSTSLGWDYMCSSEDGGVLRGQIRGLYRSVSERVQKDLIQGQIGSGQPVKEISGNSGKLAELTAGIGRIK